MNNNLLLKRPGDLEDVMDGISHTGTAETSEEGVVVQPTLEPSNSSNNSGSGSASGSGSSSGGSGDEAAADGDDSSSDDGVESVGYEDDEVKQVCNSPVTLENKITLLQMDTTAVAEDGDSRKQAVLKDCFGESNGDGAAGVGPSGDVSILSVTALYLF